MRHGDIVITVNTIRGFTGTLYTGIVQYVVILNKGDIDGRRVLFG